MKNPSSALVVNPETGEVIQPGVDYAERGLILADNLSYAVWEQVGQTLGRIEGAIQWWRGDWLNFGEKHYGETYTQAIEETGLEKGTLMNQKWVASRFEISCRHEVSFTHHQEVAALEPKVANKLLQEAEKQHLSVMALREKVRAIKHGKLMSAEIPAGKFRVIYADPPWEYENSGFNEAAEGQYPTMPLVAICAMPVSGMATNESVLFLWATNPLLREALQVMETWGFEYKTNIAWVKDAGRGKGWFLKSKHELLLIGVRPGTPQPEERPDSAFEAERGPVHSRKPEKAYEIIQSMYPHGKRIELFARQTREGWESYGNQLGA